MTTKEKNCIFWRGTKRDLILGKEANENDNRPGCFACHCAKDSVKQLNFLSLFTIRETLMAYYLILRENEIESLIYIKYIFFFKIIKSFNFPFLYFLISDASIKIYLYCIFTIFNILLIITKLYRI